MEQIYTPTKDYKVLVRCMTYNQSKYIKDALNGFAMQKTDFPFVCLVVDDASTDGEQGVIKAWMERECDMEKAEYAEIELSNIVIVPHKSNVSCTFAFYMLKQNLYQTDKKKIMLQQWRDRCEYEALCEGDDYWITGDKLKKQVDWMEKHKECMMCTTDAVIETDSGNLDWRRYKFDVDVPLRNIIENGGLFFQTASFLIRIDIRSTMPECGRKCHVGDYPLIIWCGINGTVHYIDKKMVTYRYGLGWTKSFNKRPFDVKFKGWMSEINMLKGFDKYSNFRYHESFSKRLEVYIHGIFYSSPKDLSVLKKQFPEYYRGFSVKDKFTLALYAHNLGYLVKAIKQVKKIMRGIEQ